MIDIVVTLFILFIIDLSCFNKVNLFYLFFCLLLIFLYKKYKKKEYTRLVKKYNNNKKLCDELLLRKDLERLYDKYGDIEIVLKIKRKTIWVGMTKDMLIDSWGEPEDTTEDISTSEVKYDSKGQPDMIKTLLKIKETYKYGRVGANRYTNYVYLLNDVVTGWKK